MVLYLNIIQDNSRKLKIKTFETNMYYDLLGKIDPTLKIDTASHIWKNNYLLIGVIKGHVISTLSEELRHSDV